MVKKPVSTWNEEEEKKIWGKGLRGWFYYWLLFVLVAILQCKKGVKKVVVKAKLDEQLNRWVFVLRFLRCSLLTLSKQVFGLLPGHSPLVPPDSVGPHDTLTTFNKEQPICSLSYLHLHVMYTASTSLKKIIPSLIPPASLN